MILVVQTESNHKGTIDVMNFNILFSSMIDISMFVDFVTITYENHMFKINLSILIKIQIHI